MATTHVVTTAADRPRPLNVVGTKVTVLAAASQNGAYGITFQEGEEGSGPPPHRHDWDEAFYVISGLVHFTCGDDAYDCAAGTLVHIPRNTVHGFNYGAGGGTMLELTSHDGTSSEMFTAVDATIDPDKPDFEKMLEVIQRNGVTVP